jgi:autotransporter-associated beta strand protein
VTLTWTAAPGATSTVIRRATISGGPYTTIASTVTGTSYVDSAASNGATYFYVIASTGAGGTGLNSAEASATPLGLTSLVWTGSSSTAWDTTTANWLLGSTAATYADGNDVAFDDSATTTTVAISSAINPDAVVFKNATTSYTVNGSAIAGSTGVTKTGAGTVTFNNANTYTGTTSITGGIVAIGVTGATSGSLGSSTLLLNQGGTFKMADTGGHNFPTNAIQGATGASATLSSATLANGYSGAISGPADATLTLSGPISFSSSGSAQCSWTS